MTSYLFNLNSFCNCSQKFIDAYSQGLNGRQAAWATHKYKGHRILPESLMNDMEQENVA
ncbi:hypothetical protein K435DRAFT_650844 [Dendrothele bispora CBS 962.96]|uniref:Uncharacterized protein n=1 Tax=Dendrothele bispora (strain CBS 962.96) TaxID=1314807 RepID=A0A4S8MLQ9_DENBC|nr:hypothetical protein K435DRAFT_650844 [Dendrothele bispora CBS 962.96]